MKLFRLLAVAFTTLLTGCTSNNALGNFQVSPLANKKYALNTIESIAFNENNGVIQSSFQSNSDSIAAYWGSGDDGTYVSYTFVGQSSVHYYRTSYQKFPNAYNEINTYIQNNCASYYYGFMDKPRYYTSGSDFICSLTRFYFVNPYVLNEGIFYFDDYTWHNIYDYV